jgi:YVTN family beta-propeller protein
MRDLTLASWGRRFPAGWPTSELHGGTVTFLFTDIEGSTRLLQELGNGYADVLGEHQRILRAAFLAHGGQEVDTQGDSFFVAFRTANDAVAAAVDAQRDLEAYSWPEGSQVRVRMGLHTGEPKVGGERYVGIGVHRAARIGAAGHGGQVLLSSTTKELAEEDLPSGVSIRDLGERRLKELDQRQRLYQLMIEGLPSEFKPLRTVDVELKRKRRRMYAGAALIGVAAAAVAIPVFALGQGSSGSAAAEVAPNSVAVIDPKTNRVTDDVAVGARPAEIVSGFGSVWVANRDDGTVSRIDPETRRVVRLIPINVEPTGLAAGAGGIWFASTGQNSYVNGNQVVQIRLGRIDPAFDSLAGTIELRNRAGNGALGPVAAGRSSVWVTTGSGAVRFDPATKRETEVEAGAQGSILRWVSRSGPKRPGSATAARTGYCGSTRQAWCSRRSLSGTAPGRSPSAMALSGSPTPTTARSCGSTRRRTRSRQRSRSGAARAASPSEPARSGSRTAATAPSRRSIRGRTP